MKFIHMLTGVVHPERADVNISPIHLYDEYGNHLIFSICKSRIACSIEGTEELDENSANNLRLLVDDKIRNIVDSLGFTIGCGYDVEIIQIYSLGDTSFSHFISGVEEVSLKDLCKKEQISFSNIISLFNSDFGIYLNRSLSDLRLAIRSPQDTAFYCYRAIECLSHYFRHNGELTKSQAWSMLRNSLKIRKEDIIAIKDSADPIRHGNPLEENNSDRQEIMMNTWDITIKFIKFAMKTHSDT
ncbi:hypothetical protein WAX88_20980 (plasmid) [Photobacterium damselae subsp. damselae]|uniref:hypothetical protein n=1 Tax=Photobacterium damselae TaxID=38293 RepID=UPI00311B1595